MPIDWELNHVTGISLTVSWHRFFLEFRDAKTIFQVRLHNRHGLTIHNRSLWKKRQLFYPFPSFPLEPSFASQPSSLDRSFLSIFSITSLPKKNKLNNCETSWGKCTSGNKLNLIVMTWFASNKIYRAPPIGTEKLAHSTWELCHTYNICIVNSIWFEYLICMVCIWCSNVNFLQARMFCVLRCTHWCIWALNAAELQECDASEKGAEERWVEREAAQKW